MLLLTRARKTKNTKKRKKEKSGNRKLQAILEMRRRIGGHLTKNGEQPKKTKKK